MRMGRRPWPTPAVTGRKKMNNLFNIFLQPFSYAFMLRGLAASVIVGVVCAVVGVYVVLRGMAFFGDALAHAVLPGVALGYLLSGGSRETLFLVGAGCGGAGGAGSGRVSKHAEIREDTAIGILFASMFALGIALISTVRSYTVDLSHFLFGDVLGVSVRDLVLTAVFGAVILLVIFFFYKEFLVLSFDPVLSATLRLPSGLVEQPSVCSDGADRLGCHADGRGGFDGGHAGHPCGNCLPAYPPPVAGDAGLGSHWGGLGGDRVVFELLLQYCLRIGHRIDGHRHFSAGFPFPSPPGGFVEEKIIMFRRCNFFFPFSSFSPVPHSGHLFRRQPLDRQSRPTQTPPSHQHLSALLRIPLQYTATIPAVSPTATYSFHRQP